MRSSCPEWVLMQNHRKMFASASETVNPPGFVMIQLRSAHHFLYIVDKAVVAADCKGPFRGAGIPSISLFVVAVYHEQLKRYTAQIELLNSDFCFLEYPTPPPIIKMVGRFAGRCRRCSLSVSLLTNGFTKFG